MCFLCLTSPTISKIKCKERVETKTAKRCIIRVKRSTEFVLKLELIMAGYKHHIPIKIQDKENSLFLVTLLFFKYTNIPMPVFTTNAASDVITKTVTSI